MEQYLLSNGYKNKNQYLLETGRNNSSEQQLHQRSACNFGNKRGFQ